jgi:hypothetical protein
VGGRDEDLSGTLYKVSVVVGVVVAATAAAAAAVVVAATAVGEVIAATAVGVVVVATAVGAVVAVLAWVAGTRTIALNHHVSYHMIILNTQHTRCTYLHSTHLLYLSTHLLYLCTLNTSTFDF